QDPRLPGVMARLGQPVSCIDVVEAAAFDKTALVNDLLDSPEVDGRWTMIQASRRGGGHVFVLASRSRERGPFLAPDKQRLDRMSKLLRGAIDFELLMSSLSDRKRVLEDTLDLATEAVVVVSQELDVLHANAPGS